MEKDKIILSEEIKNKIITPDDLIELIDVIFEDYEKSLSLLKEKKINQEPSFLIKLVKGEGESIETQDYSKIKSEKKLLKTKYIGIRVEFKGKINSQDASNVVTLSLGSRSRHSHSITEINFYSFHNDYSISGTNEEWVRSRYDKMRRIITNWKNQSCITTKFSSVISILFIICWAGLLEGIVYLFLKFFDFLEYLVIAGIITLVISFVLAIVTADSLFELYPSIELLTGPDHLHYENEKRKQVFYIMGYFIVPLLFVIIGFLLPIIFT